MATILQGKMEHIEVKQPHWHVSSSVLCNYMKKPEFLEMILQNKAIIPRYVVERLDYLKLEELERIAFPMTCFCDIPFAKVGHHMSRYGYYGIALDKQKLIKRCKVQPVHYINPESPLADDFREAIRGYYQNEKKVCAEDKVLLDYVLSTLLYMKPISNVEISGGEEEPYIYQDECEWRYIPTQNFPSSIPLFMSEDQMSEKGRNAYSDVLAKHRETWIDFEWEDIKYIIVPDENALDRIINVLKELPLGDATKYRVMSRIEISNRFKEDLA